MNDVDARGARREMSATFETPFAIGQEMWAAAADAEKVVVPCPICDGQRAVTVILGSGEHVRVECDGCGLGFSGPRGFIEEYEHRPHAVPFVIAKVESYSNDEWWLRSETGGYTRFADLYATESEARAEAERRAVEQREHNMESRQRTRRNTRRKAWTIRYHREQIKDLERQLAWHHGKVSAISERAK